MAGEPIFQALSDLGKTYTAFTKDKIDRDRQLTDREALWAHEQETHDRDIKDANTARDREYERARKEADVTLRRFAKNYGMENSDTADMTAVQSFVDKKKRELMADDKVAEATALHQAEISTKVDDYVDRNYLPKGTTYKTVKQADLAFADLRAKESDNASEIQSLKSALDSANGELNQIASKATNTQGRDRMEQANVAATRALVQLNGLKQQLDSVRKDKASPERTAKEESLRKEIQMQAGALVAGDKGFAEWQKSSGAGFGTDKTPEDYANEVGAYIQTNPDSWAERMGKIDIKAAQAAVDARMGYLRSSPPDEAARAQIELAKDRAQKASYALLSKYGIDPANPDIWSIHKDLRDGKIIDAQTFNSRLNSIGTSAADLSSKRTAAERGAPINFPLLPTAVTKALPQNGIDYLGADPALNSEGLSGTASPGPTSSPSPYGGLTPRATFDPQVLGLSSKAPAAPRTEAELNFAPQVNFAPAPAPQGAMVSTLKMPDLFDPLPQRPTAVPVPAPTAPAAPVPSAPAPSRPSTPFWAAPAPSPTQGIPSTPEGTWAVEAMKAVEPEARKQLAASGVTPDRVDYGVQLSALTTALAREYLKRFPDASSWKNNNSNPNAEAQAFWAPQSTRAPQFDPAQNQLQPMRSMIQQGATPSGTFYLNGD